MLLAAALSVTLGARDVAPADILAALSGPPQNIAQAAVAVRLPRTVLAALAGAALALAGAAMQGLTRNPLADPGILGTNAGAALAVVIALAWFGLESANAFLWVAILGSGVAAAGVYAIASLGAGGPTPVKLALAGAALSAAMASFTTAVILPRGDIGGLVQSWMIGGVGGASFDRIGPMLPFLAVATLAALASARKLNLLALGEDVARGLGENVALARILAAGAAITLSGVTTALCGPIGFVGLVVPHACRLVFGVDYRLILPFSAIGGAALLLLADVAGRLVARPAEVDAGIVTALIGAPVFIWIVRRGKAVAL
ncbi:MAG TPA: iron ABC transporter permease [Rhodopila sp.]